jgi:hypothetical protein
VHVPKKFPLRKRVHVMDRISADAIYRAKHANEISARRKLKRDARSEEQIQADAEQKRVKRCKAESEQTDAQAESARQQKTEAQRKRHEALSEAENKARKERLRISQQISRQRNTEARQAAERARQAAEQARQAAEQAAKQAFQNSLENGTDKARKLINDMVGS